MTKYVLLLVTCGLILLISEINGVLIEFYNNKNYSDLIFRSISAPKCNNVPGNQIFVGSIKTDTCLIVYLNPHCKSEWSWKKLPNDGLIWPTHIGSYHTCNEDEGGPHLNVDITTYPDTQSQIPTVLQNYKRVCTCQNIPNNVQQRNKWSINNHGNELKAYYEPDCSELKFKSLSIRAGHSADSRNIYSHEKRDLATYTKHKIQSFGPDPNSVYFKRSCENVRPTTTTTPKPPPIPTIMDLELLEPSSTSSHSADLSADDPEMNQHEPFSKISNEETEIQIDFYENPNYRNFLFERNSSSKCNNIPKPGDSQWVSTEIGSIKTSVCLMLYSNYECTGRSIQIESEGNANLTSAWESTVTGPETLSLIYDKIPNWKWTTKSFHICSENDHGSGLSIDLTEYHDSMQLSSVPKTFQSYRDICTCRNIPRYVQENKLWSINNYGNSLVAYFEQDCETTLFEPVWIPAGHSSYSIGFGSFNKTEMVTGLIHKIKSFGPDPNSAYFKINCVRLYSTIVKFEIMEPQHGASGPLNYVERNIEMTASKTVFRNWGPAQLSQTYSATKSVREAFHLETGTSLSKMNSVSVDSSFDIDTKSGNSGSRSRSTQNHKDWGKSESNSITSNLGWGKAESSSIGSHKGYGNTTSESHGSNQQLGHTETKSKASQQGYGNSQTDSRGSNTGFSQSNSRSEGSHHSNSNTNSQSRGSHTGYSDSESNSKGKSFGSETSAGVEFMGIGASLTQKISVNTNTGHETTSSQSGGSSVGEDKSVSTSSGRNTGSEQTASISGGSNVGHEKTFSTSGGTNEEHGKSSSVSRGSTFGKDSSSTNSGGSSTGNEKSASLSGGKSMGYEGSSSLSGGVRVGLESSSSFFQEASFREGLRKAYETSDSRSTSQSNSTTVENTRTFTATQVITVPSCSEHVVHAYVKMVTNKRIEYRAVTKITGRLGRKDMTAAEVKQFMDRRLEYIDDFDANTVLAYSVGHLKAEYGVSSLISAEGQTIHKCVEQNQLASCPVCETYTNDAATCPEVPTCAQQNGSDIRRDDDYESAEVSLS